MLSDDLPSQIYTVGRGQPDVNENNVGIRLRRSPGAPCHCRPLRPRRRIRPNHPEYDECRHATARGRRRRPPDEASSVALRRCRPCPTLHMSSRRQRFPRHHRRVTRRARLVTQPSPERAHLREALRLLGGIDVRRSVVCAAPTLASSPERSTCRRSRLTTQAAAPTTPGPSPRPPIQGPATNRADRPWPLGSVHSGSAIRRRPKMPMAIVVPISDPTATVHMSSQPAVPMMMSCPAAGPDGGDAQWGTLAVVLDQSDGDHRRGQTAVSGRYRVAMPTPCDQRKCDPCGQFDRGVAQRDRVVTGSAVSSQERSTRPRECFPTISMCVGMWGRRTLGPKPKDREASDR